MARKDWFYVPLPLEQARALDEILTNKECEECGIVERTELIRFIIGFFIERYNKNGKSFVKTKNNSIDED